MENEFLDEVLNCYRENRWEDILKLNEHSKDINALKLLWVWPSTKNLMYLKRSVENFGCEGIISIGCGCGLLEWIIHKSTGLNTIGYEINREWWDSKYSNPQFIELRYPPENLTENHLDSRYALLFCYFNDGSAFRKYIRNYTGDLVIVIGPNEGTERHTDPQPFEADFGSTEWVLRSFREVKNTGDFIAAYARSNICMRMK